MVLRRFIIIILTCLSFSSWAATLKVVGGTSTTTAPDWLAALYINVTSGNTTTTYFCGANLINSEWLVTAAHCVDYSNASVKAVLGIADLSTVTASDYVTIDQIDIYSGWDSSTDLGDIALLHLATAQSSRTTITLPALNTSSNLADGISMQVYGWGETSAGVSETAANITDVLQTAYVTYHKDYAATTTYPDHLFAGGNSTDTCFGDSGGPLLYNNILYGITSIGLSTTCATSSPGGYTDVSYYRTWIDQTINNYTATTTNSSSDDSSSSGGGGSIDFMLFFILIPVAGLRWYQRLRL